MATQGVTAIQKRRTLWQWLKGYTGQKYMTTALFLAIPVALLILFTIIPAVNMIIFSFQQRDQLGVNVQWGGFDIYKTLFTDMAYLSTLINSLYYFVGSFIQLGLALFIATLLCSKIKFAGLFKGVIFFPYLMNGVAVALIFQRFFRGDDGGTLNSIIALFGADPVKWLSNGAINNWCLVFASARRRPRRSRRPPRLGARGAPPFWGLRLGPRCRHPAGGCRGSGGRRAEGGFAGGGRGGRGRGKAPCWNRAGAPWAGISHGAPPASRCRVRKARRATRPEGGFGGGRRPPPTAAKPPALRACVLPIWQGAVSGGAFVLEPAQKFAEGAATLCILAADMIR